MQNFRQFLTNLEKNQNKFLWHMKPRCNFSQQDICIVGMRYLSNIDRVCEFCPITALYYTKYKEYIHPNNYLVAATRLYKRQPPIYYMTIVDSTDGMGECYDALLRSEIETILSLGEK